MNIKFNNLPCKEKEQENKVNTEGDSCVIILHNDDFNTFDYVIDSLVEVCGHSLEQAQQCTFLVHYKGKCEVKTGSFKKLIPKHEALLDKGLSSQLEIL